MWNNFSLGPQVCVSEQLCSMCGTAACLPRYQFQVQTWSPGSRRQVITLPCTHITQTGKTVGRHNLMRSSYTNVSAVSHISLHSSSVGNHNLATSNSNQVTLSISHVVDHMQFNAQTPTFNSILFLTGCGPLLQVLWWECWYFSYATCWQFSSSRITKVDQIWWAGNFVETWAVCGLVVAGGMQALCSSLLPC